MFFSVCKLSYGYPMRAYSPRYYQTEALASAKNYMGNGGRAGLAVLPTGTGKSHIIAELIQELFLHNNKHKILMVTHVKELIEQNYEKLKLHWKTPKGRPPAGINSAGLSQRHFTQPIIYAGIQSIYKDASKFGKVTALLIDECHLLSDKSTGMYKTFIKGLRSRNPALRIFGFTATPFRMDMGHLVEGDTFDDVFYDISQGANFTKLITEGYLSHLKGIQPKEELDLSKVERTKNEFKEASLDQFVNRSEITKKIVAETIQWAEDRKKGLAFCVSKSHAEDMSSRFNEAGLNSTFIHSGLSAELRAERLSDYKNGRYSLITNVGVLTTGFDAPDIDYILMARPTRSPSLHIQMLGRGMRPHQGKNDCLVLDYGGNIKRLGFINEVSLPKEDRSGSDVARVKSCKNCNAFLAISANECPFCHAQVQSKPNQITPGKSVHRGNVIGATPKQSTNNVSANSKSWKESHPYLQIDVTFEENHIAILKIYPENKADSILAILMINFIGQQQSDRSGLGNQKPLGQVLAHDLTKNNHRRIGQLEKYVRKNWKNSRIKILKHDDKTWARIWEKLIKLPGHSLMMLLSDYFRYAQMIKKENKKIDEKKEAAVDRYLRYVFYHPQASCPFDENKGQCLFEETRTKRWVCCSCKKLKSKDQVVAQFRKLHPHNSIMPIAEFFEKRLV